MSFDNLDGQTKFPCTEFSTFEIPRRFKSLRSDSKTPDIILL